MPTTAKFMSIDRSFLTCRDLGHAWEWTTDAVVERAGVRRVVFTRHLRCLRCTTTRTDKWMVTPAHIIRGGARYAYPEGYVVKGGLTREQARLLLFAHLTREGVAS